MTCDNTTIIKKVSLILNIHEERLSIKKRDVQNLADYSFPSGEYVFINDTVNDTLTRIDSIADNLLNKAKNEIIIIKDDIYSNIEEQKKKMNEIKLKENSFIQVLNDKYVVNSKLCDDTIQFLEKTIENEPNIIQTEKWENCRNVNAKYIISEYIEKNNPNLFHRINMCYRKIISELINMKYSISQIGYHNNTFTVRKIYGPTREHADGLYNNNESKHGVRYASCIINLNNDYNGGEFIFKEQNFKYKMKKNDIIIFPPYYSHPHLTLPLEDRTYRYTINTWFLVKN